MSKNRKEKVKEKLKKYREVLRKKINPKAVKTKKKNKPSINPKHTALENNNFKLRERARKHIEELEFKEANKQKADEHFSNLKTEQDKITKEFHESE